MKIEKDNSITIADFKGIGQSVLDDYSDIQGVNINIPGVVSAGYKFESVLETIEDTEFSIFSGDYIRFDDERPELKGIAVTLTTTGTLPGGLSTDTIYYLDNVSSSGTDFYFCEKIRDIGTTHIDITSSGTGTHTIHFITPKRIIDYTYDNSLNLYLLDDNDRIWFNDVNYSNEFYLLDGNDGADNGIIYYSGYILVFNGSSIKALETIQDPFSDTLNWTSITATFINSSSIYPRKGAVPFYSQYDNAVYFHSGNNSSTGEVTIGLIEVNTGKKFNPSDTNTFSIVKDVIYLPNNNNLGYVQSINEYGENLIIGTGSNNIYFWDRKSLLPYAVLNMPEKNTSSIIVRAGQIFAFNGYNGKFYQISSQGYGEVYSIPEHLFDKVYTEDLNRPTNTNRIEYVDVVSVFDEILFSIETGGDCYIMSFNVKTGDVIKKHISSFGKNLSYSSSKGRIYKIIPLEKRENVTKNIFISTKKEDVSDIYAIESLYTDYYNIYNDDNAYLTTGLISYGDVYDKKTLRTLSVSFTRELTIGQEVKIQYRRNDNGEWIDLKTINYSTYGAIKDIKEEAPITDIIDLQIKIIINGYNSGETTGTSPLLKSIRLIP